MTLDEFWDTYPSLYHFLNTLLLYNENLMLVIFDAANINAQFADQAEWIARNNGFWIALALIQLIARQYGILN